MVSILNANARNRIKKVAPEIALNGAIDDLTFDTQIDHFQLGRNLHSLYTNSASVPVEIHLREALAGYGITYEVLAKNTERVRAQNPNEIKEYEIQPFAAVIEIVETASPKIELASGDELTRAAKGAAARKAKLEKDSAKRVAAKKAVANTPQVAQEKVPEKAPEEDNTKSAAKLSANKPKEPTKHPELPVVPAENTLLEVARNTYCEWASKISVRGISEKIKQVESREGVKDSDLPQVIEIGIKKATKQKMTRKEFLQVTGTLKKAGELADRGVHGYVPLGKLEVLSRAIADQKRFI